MKFKLKMLAAAAALASLAGAAHADLQPGSTGNGSLVLVAFDTSTRDWYMRDLGFLMNSFLPSNITTGTGDGGVTGNKTPEAGLSLTAANTPTFGDTSFATWLSTHVASGVRWFVSASDNTGTQTGVNVNRMITSSTNPTQTVNNTTLVTYAASGNAGGLFSFFGVGGLSITGTGDAAAPWDTNFGLGAGTLGAIGDVLNLFYFARSTGTLSPNLGATGGAFRNSAGLATVTLQANGDFSYTLAPAGVAEVPLPAAAWLLGAGLLGIGGFVRRRRAEQE